MGGILNSRMTNYGPRIFCIPALEAPMVAVLRRGPSSWFRVGAWDVENLTYEPGAWFRGRLFPQKCDLSPDGRWLAYSAQDMSADWAAGTTYEAISRLPWLHALAAWNAGTTYTRGIRFDDAVGVNEPGEPDVGDASPCLARYGLRANPPVQFAVERRRGWTETADTPPRRDAWDEDRRVRMQKPRPGGSAILAVEGRYAAFRNMPPQRAEIRYSIGPVDSLRDLPEAQWADWSPSGLLLVATFAGRLRAYTGWTEDAEVAFDHDLARSTPESAAPPDWAMEW